MKAACALASSSSCWPVREPRLERTALPAKVLADTDGERGLLTLCTPGVDGPDRDLEQLSDIKLFVENELSYDVSEILIQPNSLKENLENGDS